MYIGQIKNIHTDVQPSPLSTCITFLSFQSKVSLPVSLWQSSSTSVSKNMTTLLISLSGITQY